MDPRPRCEVGDTILVRGEPWKVVMWITDVTGVKVTFERDGESRWRYLRDLRNEAKVALQDH